MIIVVILVTSPYIFCFETNNGRIKSVYDTDSIVNKRLILYFILLKLLLYYVLNKVYNAIIINIKLRLFVTVKLRGRWYSGETKAQVSSAQHKRKRKGILF